MQKPILDMFPLDEDVRISLIGDMAQQRVVGVLLEVEVTKRFPNVRHIDTVVQLPKVIALVRFGPKPVG
jgi:hypothetical protein